MIRQLIHRSSKQISTKRVLIASTLITQALFIQNLSAEQQNAKQALLTDTTLIGTVFFDANLNGQLDKGEVGLAGVRLATVTGLVIETDAYGRFNIPSTKIKNTRFGQTQLLKLDTYSLPEGARITSENPRALRATGMGLNTVNFGVVF